MNKKLVAITLGLASLVSGCANNHRAYEHPSSPPKRYDNRENDIRELIKPPNYVIPRYRKQ